tara:strand:+ start:654 stop:1379 length:726 start_codon:yes stop_codon:yes gene_type:complete
MNKNIKIIIGIIYLLALGILLFFIFKYLNFKDLGNFAYIKENTQTLVSYKNDNFIIFTVIFFLCSILWIFLAGFATPVLILAGFIFGKWLGTFLIVTSFTIGCTLLYLLAQIYFKDFILEHLPEKVKKYKYIFNKNEFIYFMIFRFCGGAGTPFAIQNVLPVIFNMKIRNYFYSTLLGLIPMVFIINALGAGIENVILESESVSYMSVISNPGIYWPLIFFVAVLLISFLIREKIFKIKKK